MDHDRERQRMRQRIEELLAVASSMTHEVEIKTDDDFALMELCFLSKQIDHAHSVIRLGDSPDTVLIVRTMLEGLFQLKWAAQDAAARAKQWRDFAWVHDWRALRAHIAQGEQIDPTVVARIERGVADLGSTFVKRTRTIPPVQDLDRGDPFYPNWTCTGVDRISTAVRGETLYAVYKSFSDWQHWSMGGIGRALAPSSDGMHYLPHSTGWELAALALAFQCLWEVADFVNSHLNMGVGHNLQRTYEQWLREACASLSAAPAEDNTVGEDQSGRP